MMTGDRLVVQRNVVVGMPANGHPFLVERVFLGLAGAVGDDELAH